MGCRCRTVSLLGVHFFHVPDGDLLQPFPQDWE